RFPDVGMVDEDEVLGKVMVRLLPLDNIGKVD
ncbi:TPA: signal peptidase I, partial [Clostridioides difficile]|nr:signal peptidase I [Clostridioides difficile]